ncbi:MAG: threonine/serine exporter family protein [Clostridia bacterium]|nr:threonine/serine exporter family protein [Clostridia bacterium]
MDQNENKALLQGLLDFGEAMLCAGAEIGRVEDSLSRLCAAYGAEKADVFVITSSIVLTVQFQNGETLTGTRRIRKSGDLDFEKIAGLNALARESASSPVSIPRLKEKIRSIDGGCPRPLLLYAGSALASGAFALFFGGSPWDGLFSALFGLLICFFQRSLSKKSPNKAFFLFITSLICGCVICLLGKALPFLHVDMIIMGDIMLLVPGIAITTAARDMVIGDTISGATRLLECLVWAGMLAGGFMLSLLILGR